MGFSESFDELDFEILERMQADPTITHSALAKILNRSQPAIGARIKKLKAKGLLDTQIGVNFKDVNELFLLRCDMKSTRPDDIMELCDHCPYMINYFRTSGNHNISVLMASSNLKRLDNVITRHFRDKDYVSKISLERITKCGKNFVLPVNYTAEKHTQLDDPCDADPICRASRALAGVRSPEILNLM
jgi:Lrp/AsnC family transcriptional regulator, leucine-responsive regulatory protein